MIWSSVMGAVEWNKKEDLVLVSSPPFLVSYLRGASKIKVKNVNKKRMATARRLIFFGISQGIHC
jgi:hypothetical protein